MNFIERRIPPPSTTSSMTTLTQHHIDVQGATPIKHRYRRVSPAILNAQQEAVKKMLDEEVIERSASAWSSAPVMAKKANGDLHFCVDYREVNGVTKKDAYPISNKDTISDKSEEDR